MATENTVNAKRKEGTNPPSTASLKKRRVLEERSSNIGISAPSRAAMKSSQNVKSSFEEDLDRLTQEISDVGDSIFQVRRD